MNGISIIICCYNSAQRLPETLRHLAQQSVPANLVWEIVLVNNHSTDDTKEVARRFWDNSGCLAKMVIVDEFNAGLAHARKKGVETASFEYLVFCDDDNWLSPDFIAKAFAILDTQPNIGAAGGQGIAVTDGQFPDWFTTMTDMYAVGKQGVKTGDISARKSVWGAGMVLRKAAFNHAYSLPALLVDRQGGKLTSGGDSEFAMRVLLSGYSLFYDQSLVYKHYIPQSRLTQAYRDRLIESMKDAFQILDLYALEVEARQCSVGKKTVEVLKSLTRYMLSRFLGVKRWNTYYQSNLIYHFAGLKLSGLQPTSVSIKKLASALIKERSSSPHHLATK